MTVGLDVFYLLNRGLASLTQSIPNMMTLERVRNVLRLPGGGERQCLDAAERVHRPWIADRVSTTVAREVSPVFSFVFSGALILMAERLHISFH